MKQVAEKYQATTYKRFYLYFLYFEPYFLWVYGQKQTDQETDTVR